MTRTQIIAMAVLAVAAASVAGVWVYVDVRAEGSLPSIDSNDTELVSLGQAIYAEHCASCHGVNLEGQPNWKQRKPDGKLPAPPHDSIGHTWHHADPLLFAITKRGVAAVAGRPIASDMPAFDGVLNDREIAASLAFIKSRWPAAIKARHEAMNERSKAN
jgi:mono/diheme cytochrome c family protein